MTTAHKTKIVDADGKHLVAVTGERSVCYVSQEQWLTSRSFEAAETTRLNEAHWGMVGASDAPINDWLNDKLSTLRARVIYEERQNPTVTGAINTLSDDVVGPDGPTPEVQSSSKPFNDAAERVWRAWFAAPTFRPNVSGASVLRGWVEDLPRCGEFLARIGTDEAAEGPVKLRLRLNHPRDLASPIDQSGDTRMVMGVEFETVELERPLRYWINKRSSDGYRMEVEPWPAELVVHEFVGKEAVQARGWPWLTSALSTAADTRDFGDQVLDGARLAADMSVLLYTDDATENSMQALPSSTFQRRTIRMAPPGWKPYTVAASQPPAQYAEYMAEQERKIGAPLSMPLMILRRDASGHNYSSARFDGQGYGRFVRKTQNFISGTPKSTGVLTRLLWMVVAEARFDDPALRNPPPDARVVWTHPARPHVDRLKESSGAEKELLMGTLTATDLLGEAGKTLDSHLRTRKAEIAAYEDAGVPPPAWMRGETAGDEWEPDDDDDDVPASKKKEKASV